MTLWPGWTILAGLLCVSATAQEAGRYYLVPNHIQAKTLSSVDALSAAGKYKLVKMSVDQAARLSAEIHEEKKTCGGFIDVTEEVEQGVQATTLVKSLESPQIQALSFPSEALHKARVIPSINGVQKSHFLQTLQNLTNFPDRSARSATGAEAARWVKSQLKSWANDKSRVDVEYSEVDPSWSYRQPSILVKLKGSDNSLPAIVVGAHIDTFDRRMPGADDDGTGTATVMHIFKRIMEDDLRFKRDIYFAFYGAEERGLVGSGQVASLFSREGRQVRGVMQFDMTGYAPSDSSMKMFFVTDYVSRELTEYAKMLAKTYLKLKPTEIGDLRCGYPCSDHASWHRRGYPAVYPFESTFEDHNRAIHTSQDTINRLDLDHALNYLKLGVAFTIELAEPIN